MARVLKIASGLMGVVLLLMVGVIVAGRTTPEMPILVEYYRAGRFRTALVYPQAQKHMELTQFPEGQIFDWSEDGRWIYLLRLEESADFEAGTAALIRSRLNGDNQQVITRGATDQAIFWTPDKRWIVSLYQTPQGMAWRRVRPDGSDPLFLTQNLSEPLKALTAPSVYFSSDGKWMYFETALENVYRANLQDGELQDIFDDSVGYAWLSNTQFDTDWVLVYLDGILTMVQSDGKILASLGQGYVSQWLEKHNLVILGNCSESSYYCGVRLSDGEMLWQLDGYPRVTPDSEWLLVHPKEDEHFYAMRWDGTETIPLMDVHSVVWSFNWSKNNGDCLFYISEPIIDAGPELRCLSTKEWQSRFVWKAPEIYPTTLAYPMMLGRSETSRLDEFVFMGVNDTKPELSFFQVTADGKHITLLHKMGVDIVGEPTLGPQISLSWQPPILAVVALTLISTPILLSRLHFRPHPLAPCPVNGEGEALAV